MKLNKTEQRLLAEITRRGAACVEHYWGHGREGGWISGGTRDINAALSLEKKGLVRLNRRGSSMTAVGNGYVMHNSLIDLHPVETK